MTISKPYHCTQMNIWAPRYSDKYSTDGEWVALLSKSTVHHASPVIIVNFTKAKHLVGLRFAIHRQTVERCPLDSNGKIPCYAVNMSKLESYTTPQEEYAMAMEVFDA